ncbi:MAG: AEC family transporter [Paracoccaceae bacterium]
MNLVLNVFQISAPVFLLTAIGFVWVKLDIEYRVEFVTKLAMTLSLPCLIFVSLMNTQISPEILRAVSLAAIISYALVTIASFILVKVLKLNVSTFLAPLIFGNTGNLGLPLAFFAFGTEGLSYAVVIFAIMATYNFTFGVWVISGGGSIIKATKEPLVWGTILGLIFLINNWKTPLFLTSTLELIGQMAIPLMLITLGVAIARLRLINISRALVITLTKFFICLVLSIIVGRYFQLEHIPFSVLLLQLTTPVAVTSYLLATKYDNGSDDIAGLVIISTLISAIYIPIILFFTI